ncbi:hypothetical protein ACQY0O_004608 [Thecaphora frezii]
MAGEVPFGRRAVVDRFLNSLPRFPPAPRPANACLTTELDTLAESRRTFLADFNGAKRSLIRAARFECTDAQLDIASASHRVALCQQALEVAKIEADRVAAEHESWV